MSFFAQQPHDDSVTSDWALLISLLGIATALLVPALVVALRNPQRLENNYSDKRRRAKAGMEAGYLIPGVASIIEGPLVRLARTWPVVEESAEGPAYYIERELQRFDYSEPLRNLTSRMADYNRLDSLPLRSRSLCRLAVIASACALPAWLYFSIGKALRNDPLPEVTLWLSFGAAVISAIGLAGLLIANEVTLNSLSGLVDQYAD